ncbi:MAG: Unknown protein [uncultured Sulfurovum sp.]|uniref:Uncharacterized protein n=1 Tax=uncultured Sulfurovum sp. TaxID=269237 RepID=A0A6S6TGM5_9BACT|nr:MAG: Unknown protein [uncultured Sulfurovum sp.]
MINLYRIGIRYFLIMLLMLFVTGIWLLLLHASFSLESFTNYYVEKSILGLLEVTTPHLFSMGIVIFILTHFLSLNKKNSPFESKLTLTLFSIMLISNFSSFLITQETTYLIWIKIISTFLFLLLSLLSMSLVLLRLK